MKEEYNLIKELYKTHGEPLLDEIASVTLANGQGDCYQCLCNDYCCIHGPDGIFSNSCHDAIKMAIKKDILKLDIDNSTNDNV